MLILELIAAIAAITIVWFWVDFFIKKLKNKNRNI